MERSRLTPEQLDTYNNVYKPLGTTIEQYKRQIVSALEEESKNLAILNARRKQFTLELFNHYNLVTVPVSGDENCFVRSLSIILYGDDIYYPMIRSAIVEYLDTHREIFDYKDSTYRDPDIFLEKFRMDKGWAEGPAIEAASQLYQRDIRVYCLRGDIEQHPEWQSDNFPQNPQLTLSNYSGTSHFDPLLPKDEASRLYHFLGHTPGVFEAMRLRKPREQWLESWRSDPWQSAPSESEARRLLSEGEIPEAMTEAQSRARMHVPAASEVRRLPDESSRMVSAASEVRRLPESSRMVSAASEVRRLLEPRTERESELERLLANYDMATITDDKAFIQRQIERLMKAKYLKYKNKYFAEKHKLKYN